ncbi:hypothetical protein ACFLSJ_01280 [Verrucomicrobiota bacterium]
MPRADKTYLYRVFGLDVSAPFPCPELSHGNRPPQVIIRYGAVPHALPSGETVGRQCHVSPGRFLYSAEGVARYLVCDGKEIVVERAPGAADAQVRLFLLGIVLVGLLLQRGELPLHASAVGIRGEAVAFTAPSGRGKSTLAMALHNRGHPVLTDDVCVVGSQDGAGRPIVIPSYPVLRLAPETAERLRADRKKMWKPAPDEESYSLSIRDGFAAEPLPLRRLYVLEPSRVERVELHAVKGAEKVGAIIGSIACPQSLQGLGLRRSVFERCVDVARNVDVRHVRRPETGLFINELASAVEQDLPARCNRQARREAACLETA